MAVLSVFLQKNGLGPLGVKVPKTKQNPICLLNCRTKKSKIFPHQVAKTNLRIQYEALK